MQEKIAIRKKALINRKNKYFEVSVDFFKPLVELLNKKIKNKKILLSIYYPTNYEVNILKLFELIKIKKIKTLLPITKNKNKTSKTLEIKGRSIVLENFYDKVVKFDFEELCNRNLGAEDYIKITENCEFIFIKNLPNFNENNSNQQQRFITLIDIFYEKKISIMISAHFNQENFTSSKMLNIPYKRTVSRLFELTSPGINSF